MLGSLFRRLTAENAAGPALFEAITALTRQPHWYVEGQVPDTLDGRFAVLSTVTALVLARIEQFGDEGNPVSVSLTERFIEVMEAEHRELGLGDPTLGKTVRKLVGSLGRRTALWRDATAGSSDWDEATRSSLYKDEASPDAIRHSAAALRTFWNGLQQAKLKAFEEGRLQ
jgi:cytochrome b pre-mRNA-processing protein 3